MIELFRVMSLDWGLKIVAGVVLFAYDQCNKIAELGSIFDRYLIIPVDRMSETFSNSLTSVYRLDIHLENCLEKSWGGYVEMRKLF